MEDFKKNLGVLKSSAKRMVGTGWGKLIDDLYKITPPLHITDVKEKYGRLSVYVEGGLSDEMYQKISDIEDKSEVTCEKCGDPGNIRLDRPWYKSLCDKCNNEEVYFQRIKE